MNNCHPQVDRTLAHTKEAIQPAGSSTYVSQRQKAFLLLINSAHMLELVLSE